MNKKGNDSLGFIGIMLVTFIGVVVALAMYSGGITSNIGDATLTRAEVNQTVTMPASGSTVDLSGKATTGTFTLTNATSGVAVPATNYTVLNNQINTDGDLTAQLQSDGGFYVSESVNASYTYQPVGYISSAGGRSLAGIIAIFAALAIAIFALVPALKSGIFESFK